jgi:hypothetical protein
MRPVSLPEQLLRLADELEASKTRADMIARHVAPTQEEVGMELGEAMRRVSGALDAVDTAMGLLADPGLRLGRTSSMMDVITLHPEWIPSFTHLGKRIENRDWYRRRLGGGLVALHGARLWGGRRGLSAKGRAMDAVVAHARRAGCTTAQIRAYQDACSCLPGGLGELRGVVKVVVRVEGAVSQGPDFADPWALGTAYAWCVSEVYTLPEAVPVKGGWHRGLWRLSRSETAAVFAQLPMKAEVANG